MDFKPLGLVDGCHVYGAHSGPYNLVIVDDDGKYTVSWRHKDIPWTKPVYEGGIYPSFTKARQVATELARQLKQRH